MTDLDYINFLLAAPPMLPSLPRSILERLLAATGTTFVQWVALTMLARSDSGVPQEALVPQISGALKCDTPTTLAALDGLATRGFVVTAPDAPEGISLTAEGVIHFQELRQRIGRVTARVLGDVSPEEEATVHRVLGHITERANAELETQP